MPISALVTAARPFLFAGALEGAKIVATVGTVVLASAALVTAAGATARVAQGVKRIAHRRAERQADQQHDVQATA